MSNQHRISNEQYDQLNLWCANSLKITIPKNIIDPIYTKGCDEIIVSFELDVDLPIIAFDYIIDNAKHNYAKLVVYGRGTRIHGDDWFDFYQPIFKWIWATPISQAMLKKVDQTNYQKI